MTGVCTTAAALLCVRIITLMQWNQACCHLQCRERLPYLLLRCVNKQTPTVPLSLHLCVSVCRNTGPAPLKALLTPAYHPSESPGCCGRNTETMLTPTLAQTKNTLWKMNSVMPFDNNPQTDWERRTRTYTSRLDSTSRPLGFQYGQHNLKTLHVLKRPRFMRAETDRFGTFTLHQMLCLSPNADSMTLSTRIRFKIWWGFIT